MNEFGISLIGVCVKKGKPQCFSQIKKRVLDRIEEDGYLREYVLVNPDSPEDIYLSQDGVFIFFRILIDYFELDYLKSIEYYLGKRDSFNKDLELLSPNDTNNLLTIMAYNPQSEEEEKLKQFLIKNASKKIKSRKRG